MNANKSHFHNYVGLLVFFSFFLFFFKDSRDYNSFNFRDTIVVGVFSLIFYIVLKFTFIHILRLLDDAYYKSVDVCLAVFSLVALGLIRWWLSLILIALIIPLILKTKKSLIVGKISYFLLVIFSFLTFHIDENIDRLQLIGISKPTIKEVLKSKSRYISRYDGKQWYFYKVSLPFSTNTRDILKVQNCLTTIENEDISQHIRVITSGLNEKTQGKKVILVKKSEGLTPRNWRCHYDLSHLNFLLYDQKQIDVFFFIIYGI